MGKPRAEVVRFAVGGADEPRSLVWRVWTTKGKSDLYISGRLQGGDWKVSLHESGDWRFALTREFSQAQGMDERLIFEKWERPQPLREGVTPAFEIMVPSSLATALAAWRNVRLPTVDLEAASEVLRLLSERREDLVAERARAFKAACTDS